VVLPSCILFFLLFSFSRFPGRGWFFFETPEPSAPDAIGTCSPFVDGPTGRSIFNWMNTGRVLDFSVLCCFYFFFVFFFLPFAFRDHAWLGCRLSDAP